MKNSFSLVALLLSLALGAACSKPDRQAVKRPLESADEEAFSREDEVRLRQYMVKGRQGYSIYCANCHGDDGTGLSKLYPPLAGSDYLMADLKRAACISRYGLSDSIVVNGQGYQQAMQAIPALQPLDVAEILTYIVNEMNGKKMLIDARTAQTWLSECEN